MSSDWYNDWPHIRTKNTTCGDCQVITAANIYHILTEDVVGDEQYAQLVKLAKAEHGSAITIKDVWAELGIEPLEKFAGKWSWQNEADQPLPVELSLWHKYHGLHSAACVEYEPRTESFRIPNFRGTSMDGWIYGEDLMHFLNPNPDLTEPRYVMRSFGLVGK